MLKVIEERKATQQRAVEAARAYVQELRPLLGPLSAILYGSMARGDFGPGSDLDLLVISDGFPEHPLRRLELLFSKVSGDFAIEPKGLTSEEFARLTRKGTPWLVHVLKEAFTLCDDLGLFLRPVEPFPGRGRVRQGGANETSS